MSRLKLVLGVALAAGLSVGLHGAEPRALAESRDALGDPLPQGALARLGSGRFRHPGGVYGLVFSRDGKVLASTGGGHTVFFWDAATGTRRLRFDADSGESIAAVSAEGKVATEVLVDTGTFRVRDAANGQVLHELKGDTQGSLLSLAFSADGKRLVSSGVGRVIRVWDLAAGKEVRHWEVQLPDGVQPVRFSPDGKTLVGIDRHGRGAIHFWDVATGREPFPALAHQDTTSTLTFSGDGRMLASSGGDDQVRLWDTATGKELRHFGKPSQMLALAFSPDGQTLASGDMEGGLYLWDVARGQPRLEMTGHKGSVRSDCCARKCGRSPSRRTARCWPREARKATSASGIRPAARSCGLPPVTRVRCRSSPSARTARSPCPWAGTGTRGCGTWTAGRSDGGSPCRTT